MLGPRCVCEGVMTLTALNCPGLQTTDGARKPSPHYPANCQCGQFVDRKAQLGAGVGQDCGGWGEDQYLHLTPDHETQVEVVAVSVSVWCNGRRLSSGPRLHGCLVVWLRSSFVSSLQAAASQPSRAPVLDGSATQSGMRHLGHKAGG